MSWAAAFAPFAGLHDGRNDARAGEARRVGCIGADIPFELVEACGWAPVRLAGRPGHPAPDGDLFLGGGADADVRTVFQLLVEGGYGRLDRLIIAHDFEGLARLYYALREYRARWPGRAARLPEPEFLDILHLPGAPTAHYNVRRLGQLREALGGCDDDALRQRIVARNALRRRLFALREHRRAGRVSGVEALQIHAAAFLAPADRVAAWLDALLDAAAQRAVLPGQRAFITGSAHDHSETYRLIEAEDFLIVGEDHDWGDRGHEALVPETGEPMAALAERYRGGTPAAAKFSIADRAVYTAGRVAESGAEIVLCLVRRDDPAPRWDVPDQRAAVDTRPFILVDDQPYAPEPEAFRADLVLALETGAAT